MSKIKHIYHLSDIHIRNNERHPEYNEVFNTLFLTLTAIKPNSLIVITGDIMHDHKFITTDALQLLTKLLSNLSEIAPVFIIAGNHDCNTNNPNELDILTQNINKEYFVHYLNKTGTYNYKNISFGVTDIYTNEIHQISNSAEYKIALFHRSNFDISDFDGYDYVMLGDSHKYTYLNDKKTIAYSGSLIQQHYGESDVHGVLKWNLTTGKSKLIPINNNYGYHLCHIKNGKLEQITIKPKPHLTIIRENTSDQQYNEIINKLQTQYDIQGICERSAIHDTVLNCEIKYKDIHKLEIQLKYMPQSVKKLHKQIYNPKNYSSNNYTWNIIELKFSNAVCYGKNNMIDFTNYKKNHVISIEAPNGYGKTAIMDIILYCIYNQSIRCRRTEFHNINCIDMFCSLLFSIGNMGYLIERIYDNGKNSVNFWSMTNGVRTNLNGNTINDTNKIITDKIGSMEHFLMTAVYSNSSPEKNFIELLPQAKKEYLIELLDINAFGPCHDIAKEKKSIIKSSMEKLDHQLELFKPTCDIKLIKSFAVECPVVIKPAVLAKYELKTGLDCYKQMKKINPRINEKILLLEQSGDVNKLVSLYLDEPYINELYTELIAYRLELFRFDNMRATYETYVKELSAAEQNAASIDLRNELASLKSQFETYTLYTSITHPNGIPSEILKHYLPEIETDINARLKELEQKIQIKLDKALNVYVCREDDIVCTKISCGYVKFIVNIMFKIVLHSLSLVPKANFLIIDEGWESFDEENKGCVGTLLGYVKKHYDHVMIMSHLEYVRCYADYAIDVKKKGVSSYIVNYDIN